MLIGSRHLRRSEKMNVHWFFLRSNMSNRNGDNYLWKQNCKKKSWKSCLWLTQFDQVANAGEWFQGFHLNWSISDQRFFFMTFCLADELKSKQVTGISHKQIHNNNNNNKMKKNEWKKSLFLSHPVIKFWGNGHHIFSHVILHTLKTWQWLKLQGERKKFKNIWTDYFSWRWWFHLSFF